MYSPYPDVSTSYIDAPSSSSLKAPAPAPPPLWKQSEQPPKLLRTLSLDDDDDDDLNIDTSNMTQEEKNNLKAQRKLRKMNREKLKRSKVNDQFDHLCQVLHVGKTTRVEKLTVLNETLRALYQLKAENKLLKEQTKQMKELNVRIQGGEPVAVVLNTMKQPQGPKVPPPPPPRRTGTKDGHAMLEIPTFEPLISIKDEPLFDQPAKEMMNFGKDGFPKEETTHGWNMFEQPQPNDLDFAFGDSGFMWQPPRQDGAVFPIESECDFGRFVISRPEQDSMDLFLTTSDECDLLC